MIADPHSILSVSGRTRLLGVCGWPVQHSLSPPMHNAALRAAGLDYVYVAFPIDPAHFQQAARGLGRAGLVGLNCTVPHKYAALEFCDSVDDEARLVQAVNTIHYLPNGRTEGTNTDIEGYTQTLRHEGDFDMAARTVVQLGAGGTGRATALAAVKARVGQLVLVNRTLEKAQALARELLAWNADARIETLSPLANPDEVRHALGRADLVTNVTSLGLREGDPFPCDVAHISPQALVFDAPYSPQGATAWLRAAAAHGCRTLDGLGMLVRQGAASFLTWTGVEPDLEVMFGAIETATQGGEADD